MSTLESNSSLLSFHNDSRTAGRRDISISIKHSVMCCLATALSTAKNLSREKIKSRGPVGLCRDLDLCLSYMREKEGGFSASAPGSPAQGRILGVAAGHRVRGTGVI